MAFDRGITALAARSGMQLGRFVQAVALIFLEGRCLSPWSEPEEPSPTHPSQRNRVFVTLPDAALPGRL